MNENKHFLEVKDLVVEYTSDKRVIHAVNSVSFSLERGKTLGIVGETGAGKTTIAKSILRILPEFQASIKDGEIRLEGEDILSLSEKEMLHVRGNRIAMIFQDPMTALNPVMKVGNQIAEAVRLHSDLSGEKAKERAVEMLEMVGIPGTRYTDYPHQFSGGMKQRVVIAMALACNPDLLLADEPTTALDVTIQAQVLEMIDDLKRRHDTSMILITHDLGIIAENADEVAVVYAGEIVESGTKEELFDRYSHPYTEGLFGAIPDISHKEHRLTPVPGLPPDPSDLPKGCHFSPRCPYATVKCRNEKPGLENRGGTHFCRCFRDIRKEKGAQ